jgi:hypothetical protein
MTKTGFWRRNQCFAASHAVIFYKLNKKLFVRGYNNLHSRGGVLQRSDISRPSRPMKSIEG